MKAIEEFTELGAGFKLAMRDLEIRGAGNLLGSQQHGNIASVGFGMYVSMLEEAIAKAQNKEVEREVSIDPAIDLEVDAFIDDAYIKDSARKISVYQRLLHIKSKEQLDDMTDELIDRFGTPTDPVDRLLRIAQIKEQGSDYWALKVSYVEINNLPFIGMMIPRWPTGIWGCTGRSLEEDEVRRYQAGYIICEPQWHERFYFDHYGSGDEGFEPEIIV